MTTTYQASKTRSNRPGWSVIFSHPARTDARGKKGLKVRKGLGTSNDAEADRMVSSLNLLLSDPSWWTADRRMEAERRFGSTIAAIFFDGIETGKDSSYDMRESVLPLPSRQDDYTRVMLAGTTGAGKTTLLRHLIGSDHRNDRFPSTSTAKTTTADIEVILDDGTFRASITFMTEHEVRCAVDECLEAACEAALRGFEEARIADALLEHREQRFRLSYVLGTWQQALPTGHDEEDFDLEDDEQATSTLPEDEMVAVDERMENGTRIREYVQRIQEVSRVVAHTVAQELGSEFQSLANANERQDWIDQFIDALYSSTEFADLSLDIMEDINSRFDQVETGDFERSSSGWPRMWYLEEETREQFLSQVRWFSSNHVQQFGKLLTPLVDGIRVSGQFTPLASGGQAAKHRLVLLDGEGLGHSAKEATSVSTKVTSKFTTVDMILLVDTAQSPLQAASLELLKSVGSSGHGHKLAVTFTHFDQVRGDNLRSFKDRRNHVRLSIGNAMGSLRDALGAPVAEVVQRQLESNDYYLGDLDKPTSGMRQPFQNELYRLLGHMDSVADLTEPTDLAPMYDMRRLGINLRDAVDGFKNPWMARLGLNFDPAIRKEHWGRVKALTRRIASAWDDEYNGLRPLADMIANLQVYISRWLDVPDSWTRAPVDENESQQAIDFIRSRVFEHMHSFARRRLIRSNMQRWSIAYAYSGRGSARERAQEMFNIFRQAAPSITSFSDPTAEEFVDEVIDVVRDAIRNAGGTIHHTIE